MGARDRHGRQRAAWAALSALTLAVPVFGTGPATAGPVPVGTITTVNTQPVHWPVYLLARPDGKISVTGGGSSLESRRVSTVHPDGTVSSVSTAYRCMPPELTIQPDRADCEPMGLALDPAGKGYLAWSQNNVVEGPDGVYAGTYNSAGFAGDGGPADQALLETPQGITFDRFGNLYIVDRARIRKVDPTGTITTFAGTGVSGFSGDGGPATAAQIRNLNNARFITTDADGNVYFGDYGNGRIRKIDTNGIITTVAGTGTHAASPDGADAATSPINVALGLAVAPTGELLFAESFNDKIRMIDADGKLQTVAGTGVAGYSGDGGPANAAMISDPWGLAFDTDNNLLIADNDNDRIRKVTFAHGTITGTLTADTTPAAGVTVTLLADWPTWRTVATTTTGPDGTYTFPDLPWGRYKLRFFDGQGRYQRRWWNGQDTYQSGAVATLTAGGATTADDTLTPAVAALTGHITDATTTNPIPGARVQLFTANGYLAGTTTSPDGTYRFNALPPGTYQIRALDPVPWAHRSAWYPGVPDHPSATTITITPGTTTTDLALPRWN